MDSTGHLAPAERSRYAEKIELIGVDPYNMNKNIFCADKELYPAIQYRDIVNYLVCLHSAYTMEQHQGC